MVDGCPNKDRAKGFCTTHLPRKLCSVDGCSSKAQARGLCKKHGATPCPVTECTNKGKAGGVCKRHGKDGGNGGSNLQNDGTAVASTGDAAADSKHPKKRRRYDLCKVCNEKQVHGGNNDGVRVCAKCRKRLSHELEDAVQRVDPAAVAAAVSSTLAHLGGHVGKSNLYYILLCAVEGAPGTSDADAAEVIRILCASGFDPSVPMTSGGLTPREQAVRMGVCLPMISLGGAGLHSESGDCITDLALQRLMDTDRDALDMPARLQYTLAVLEGCGGCRQCAERGFSWVYRVAVAGYTGLLARLLAHDFACYVLVGPGYGYLPGWLHVLQKAAVDGESITLEATLMIMQRPAHTTGETFAIMETFLEVNNDTVDDLFVGICQKLTFDCDYVPEDVLGVNNGDHGKCETLLENSARGENTKCTRALLEAGATATDPYITEASTDFIDAVSYNHQRRLHVLACKSAMNTN